MGDIKMDNLYYSLNATMPIFLVMILGFVFRKIGLLSENLASGINKFVFKVALPTNLFIQLYDVDIFTTIWDTKYVIFCFVATLISVLISWGIAHFLRDRSVRGEVVQASYRSSASLLGMAYIENIYGSASVGSLMMIGCVPLYNVSAVIILSLMNPNNTGIDGNKIKSSLIGIIKNPIIWGIILGFAWSLTGILFPTIAETTVSYIGRTASPLGLLAMGAMIDFGSIIKQKGPVILSVFMKLVLFVVIFAPVAIWLGFEGEKLIALIIMFGSASTVAGFIMAKNMGHEGNVSAGSAALSTLLSSFTMTLWIWLLRSGGYI